MSEVSKHQTFVMERMLRSALTEHPKNPRRITESAQKKLRSKIKDIGLLQPVIFNRVTGYLLGGHQRMAVMDGLERYKPGVNDYYLDVSVVELDEKKELEAIVFLNNASAMGQWNTDVLADLSGDVSFDDMGLDRVDVEIMFDGDALFDALFDDAAPVKETKDALESIKADRASMKDSKAQSQSVDYYVTVVCKDQQEKAALMKHLGIPKGEIYISPSEIFALSR